MPTVKARIEEKLRLAYAPDRLEVIDESDRHAGHAGAREGGETHFRVKVTAGAFDGVGRIDRHRAIHTLLADELAGGVHALALEIRGRTDPGSA